MLSGDVYIELCIYWLEKFKEMSTLLTLEVIQPCVFHVGEQLPRNPNDGKIYEMKEKLQTLP